MITLEDFPHVYYPTCRGVQPARFEVLKADAYIDHDSLDIVCSQCRSVIGSLHADKPNQNARWEAGGTHGLHHIRLSASGGNAGSQQLQDQQVPDESFGD